MTHKRDRQRKAESREDQNNATTKNERKNKTKGNFEEV